jgi:hypothetical protein
MTAEFAKRNKVISRTIQIRGDQTLEDLHHAIFAAFDREEEHMYEFQIGGQRAEANTWGLALLSRQSLRPEDDAGNATLVKFYTSKVGCSQQMAIRI